MSEMQRNRGIIKRISTKENFKEIYDKLVADGLHDPKYDDVEEDGNVNWIDSDNYMIHDDALFDISDAPDQSDDEADEVNEAERLNETDYKIHAYYYNGGADLSEMLSESLPKADEEYERKNVERVKFVRFIETNDHEGETWNFWLQLDNNETELEKLAELLEDDEYAESFELDMTPVTEDIVDILVKYSDEGYMSQHNKIVGKFKMPYVESYFDGEEWEYFTECFYKGGIRNQFNG